jgi:peroxiredoxin
MQMGAIRPFALGALLVGVGAAAAQAPDQKPTPPATARVGQDAPDFTLSDCEGHQHTLSGHKDQIVVLEWLNQQCPVSRGAVPVMKEMRRKYAGQPVLWLGIDSTYYRKPQEDVQYAKDQGLDVPILMDTDGRVGHLYGAKVTPHIFIVSKGKLVYAGALRSKPPDGKPETESRNYLDEALQAALAGKDVPVAETKAWGCSVKYKPQGEERKDHQPREDQK